MGVHMSYLSSAVLLLVVGALGIVVGGLSTTAGWNEFNQHIQRKAQLEGAVREWQGNKRIVDVILDYKNTLDSIPEPATLPTFETQGVRALLTSHLIASRSAYKDDSALLVAAANYVLVCSFFNDLLSQSNRVASLNIDIDMRKKGQKSLLNSNRFDHCQSTHEAFGQALRTVAGPSPAFSESIWPPMEFPK